MLGQCLHSVWQRSCLQVLPVLPGGLSRRLMLHVALVQRGTVHAAAASSFRHALVACCRGEPARRRVMYDIQRSIMALCKLRGVHCDVLPIHSARGAEADPEIVHALHNAIVDSRPLYQQLMAHARATPAASAAAGAAGDGAPWEQEEAAGSCGGDGSRSSSSAQCSSGDGSAPPAVKADVPVMVSGAGHDALAISDIANFGMMFVRCRGGISHSPLEYVKPEDTAAATTALMVYLEKEVM